MVLLTGLPPEVVTTILGFVAPDDLVSVRLVCHWLHDCIQHNAQLYRTVYYNYFDPPPTNNLEWEREIWDFLRLKSICAAQAPSKTSELDFVVRTVKRLLAHSARVRPGDTDTLFHHREFRNIAYLSTMLNTRSNHVAFFCRSFLFDRMRHNVDADADTGADADPLALPAKPLARHQASAELHCLLGSVLLACPEVGDEPVVAYPYAVAKVYDMREHSLASLWGPFMADGTRDVDWEKLEAILIVLRYNIRTKGLLKFRILNKYWNNTFLGSWQDSYMPMIRDASPPPGNAPSLDREDPYGVTGTWMRLVCFLDYSDFFRFNFRNRHPPPDNVPRPPYNPGEELRLLTMKIHVTAVAPPGDDDHPDFPVVHFEGSAHSMDNPYDENANSALRGTVRTTKQGQVHWTTFSVFDDQPRWRSESIQIGGRRSGRGVVGNWFDTNYDAQGPCGPTAFWKLHEKKSGDNGFGGPFEAFTYLLANSVTNGVNIIINIHQHQNFAHFGIHNDDEEEEEEEASDGAEDGDVVNHDGSDDSDSDYVDGGDNGLLDSEADDGAQATVPNRPPFEIVPILEGTPENVDHNHEQPAEQG